jgi:hypothetical protein
MDTLEQMDRNEAALVRALRAVIHAEINTRLDQLTENNSFEIEDYRNDIDLMISEYINYNVTVTIEG